MTKIFQQVIKFNIILGKLSYINPINFKIAYYICNKTTYYYIFQFYKVIFKLKKVLHIIYNISKKKGFFLFIPNNDNNNIIKYIAKLSKNKILNPENKQGFLTNRKQYLTTQKLLKLEPLAYLKLPYLFIVFNNKNNIIKEINKLQLPIICFSDLYLSPNNIEYNLFLNLNSLDSTYLYSYLIYKAIIKGRRKLRKK
jgi:ribosomal protein S2